MQKNAVVAAPKAYPHPMPGLEGAFPGLSKPVFEQDFDDGSDSDNAQGRSDSGSEGNDGDEGRDGAAGDSGSDLEEAIKEEVQATDYRWVDRVNCEAL